MEYIIKLLQNEFVQNIIIVIMPFFVTFLTGITASYSKNKIVSEYGTSVILRGYEKFNNYTGEERKKKANEYFKQLAKEKLPPGLRELALLWFTILGHKDVQNAYDEYWEDFDKRYQWRHNVLPDEEGAYYE